MIFEAASDGNLIFTNNNLQDVTSSALNPKQEWGKTTKIDISFLNVIMSFKGSVCRI